MLETNTEKSAHYASSCSGSGNNAQQSNIHREKLYLKSFRLTSPEMGKPLKIYLEKTNKQTKTYLCGILRISWLSLHALPMMGHFLTVHSLFDCTLVF